MRLSNIFGAGGDIKWIYDEIYRGLWWWGSPVQGNELLESTYGLFNDLADLHIPVVSLANGLTLGGHLFLASAGISVVTASSELGAPEVYVGYYPNMGGTFLLLKRLRKSLAKLMAVTNYRMTGVEAVQYGLADVLSSDANLKAIEEFVSRQARSGSPIDEDHLKNEIR